MLAVVIIAVIGALMLATTPGIAAPSPCSARSGATVRVVVELYPLIRGQSEAARISMIPRAMPMTTACVRSEACSLPRILLT